MTAPTRAEQFLAQRELLTGKPISILQEHGRALVVDAAPPAHAKPHDPFVGPAAMIAFAAAGAGFLVGFATALTAIGLML